MRNKIVNKQIPISSIIDVANYLEKYKEDYLKKFHDDELKNKNIPIKEQRWSYGYSHAEVNYTIEFHDGKSIIEKNYNWFIDTIKNPKIIKCIELALNIWYTSDISNDELQNNSIHANIHFREAFSSLRCSDIELSVETKNRESEAYSIHSNIVNILEKNEDRFNKTIKLRQLRIQSFSIVVGLILSYILYLLLIINKSALNPVMVTYLSNKYLIVFGQWFLAILLGNLFGSWYILSIYKPLLPNTTYAGYDYSSLKSIYKDDIDEYVKHSEIHIGQFWDAAQRRSKIEKIYKITNKIILVQLLISIVLFFVL